MQPQDNKYSMKVTLLQTDIAWVEPEINMKEAERMMSDNPHSDIYILPEMWNSGFVTEPSQAMSAIKASGKTLEWMTGMAKRHNAAICGSIAALNDSNQPVNRLYFVKPDGETACYDKRHLFGHGGEARVYTAGNKRIVTEYRGMRFLMATCYDLRFPVWLRNKDEYDTIILVANWPEKRQYAWDILTKARAMENQCYVVACNRTGSDPVCKYAGGSTVIDPKGYAIYTCDENSRAAEVEISMDNLKTARSKFRVLADKDNFVLNI